MSRIVRNISAVGAAFVSNTLLTFLQIKLLTRHLPQSELGEYFATAAIGAIVSVLAQVGLPAVVLRFTAKYDALGQPGRIRRLLALGWGLTLALSALLLLLEAWVAPRLLARLYDEPPAASNVLLATGVFIAMALRGVTYAGFDGLRRMSYPAVLENLNVAAITLVIAALRHRLGITFLLTLSLVSGLAVFLAATVLLLRLLGKTRASGGTEASRGTEPLIREISPFWWGAALNGVIGIGFGYADKLLVSLFLSFEMVSIFYVADRVIFLLKRLLAVPLQVASPEITRRWELGRREELRCDMGFLLKIQFALGVLVAALAFLAAEVAVLVVSNASFMAAAGLMRVMTVSIVLMSFYAPITTLLRSIERIQLALLSDVLWLGLYVVLGVVLMPRSGLMGIVLAHVAASAAAAVWNLVAGHRVARIAWDVGGVSRVLAAGLLLAAPSYGAVRLLGRAHPAAAGIGAALAFLVAYNLALVGCGALTADDRRRLADLTGRGRLARLLDFGLFWPARLGARRQGGAGVR
jgi:O-antigen/teichoic acid export membrane protein